MTKLIPFVVLAVVTVGCASDNVTLPTTGDSMVLSSVSNVEISASDMEKLLLLEACLDFEVRLMEKKLEVLISSLHIYTTPGEVIVDSIEGHIDRIGKEQRNAVYRCVEKR